MKKSRKTKKKSAPRSHSTAHNRRGKSKNATRIVVIGPKRGNKKNTGKRRAKRNPHFFGQNVPAVKMAMYVAGGLIGVAAVRIVLPMLPDAITGNNLFAVGAALGIAALVWWIGTFLEKDFGAAVGFGALMGAGSQALNAWVPSVGHAIGLSGRGAGDFVPGRFSVPQNPITDAITGGVGTNGSLMTSAYPVAYGRAA